MFRTRVVGQACFFATLLMSGSAIGQEQSSSTETEVEPAIDAAEAEGNLLQSIRQITFEGRRAGEGYFSSDGTRMVFQSERESGNPFYQIYLTDLETGDIERVSPGSGKTTCAWIHPDGERVLFASTQDDPEAVRKQQQELDMRASGEQRRYAWDYDENFELYETVPGSGQYKRLTDARGYDAEGSYSPDGRQIVFASNRAAYEKELTGKAKEMFAIDPALRALGVSVRVLFAKRNTASGST